MKWNAIHHDLHLSVLAGVWGVFAVVFASPHPAAHRILHLEMRNRRREAGGKREVLEAGGVMKKKNWKRDDAKERS